MKSMLRNKLINFLKNYWVLLLLFVLSFSIRFIFIFRDIPFITHPDEPTVVNSTLNLKYSLNPKHFDWPTFYYYVNYLFFSVLFFIERVSSRIGMPNPQIVDNLNFYLLSRIVTVVFGALSVIFTYKLTYNLTRNTDTSIIAAILLAIIPLHVTRSAQSLTDVPMLFLAIVSLYYLSRNLENFAWRNIYLSAFFVGLSTSTKYNGYMFVISTALFLILIKKLNFKDLSSYIKTALSGAAGFLIGTPFALLDYKTFLRDDGPKGALWQFKNVGSLPIVEQISAFFNNIGLNLPPDFGFIPWILAISFILYFFFQTKFKFKDNYLKFIFILICQFIFILWSTSGVKIQRSHYFIGLYAMVPIFGALLLSKNKKFETGTLIVTCVLSIIILSGSMSNNSRVEFFERVIFEDTKKNYNILYSDSELSEVLRKLDIRSDEFDPRLMDFNSKFYSHIVSSQDLCQSSTCEYKLVGSILSREEGNDLYIYEFKKK